MKAIKPCPSHHRLTESTNSAHTSSLLQLLKARPQSPNPSRHAIIPRPNKRVWVRRSQQQRQPRTQRAPQPPLLAPGVSQLTDESCGVPACLLLSDKALGHGSQACELAADGLWVECRVKRGRGKRISRLTAHKCACRPCRALVLLLRAFGCSWCNVALRL